MATLFVRHTVEDYARWKRVYDGFAPTRKKMGVTGASVHRDPADANALIVVHHFKDLNAARAFVDSEELRSAMERSGVAGPPTIWLSEDIEETPY